VNRETIHGNRIQPSQTRETHSLIGSDTVEGTAVYRSNGDKVGNIARVMIGKQSGKVGYVLMRYVGNGDINRSRLTAHNATAYGSATQAVASRRSHTVKRREAVSAARAPLWAEASATADGYKYAPFCRKEKAALTGGFNAGHRHQQFDFVVVFVSPGASLVTLFDSQPVARPVVSTRSRRSTPTPGTGSGIVTAGCSTFFSTVRFWYQNDPIHWDGAARHRQRASVGRAGGQSPDPTGQGGGELSFPAEPLVIFSREPRAARAPVVSTGLSFCPCRHHHSASRARIIAGLSGFLILSQPRHGPDR
jgi:hypothetical protein